MKKESFRYSKYDSYGFTNTLNGKYNKNTPNRQVLKTVIVG